MNSQKKAPENVLALLREHGAVGRNVSYYAWPMRFGTTAGPRPGIAGQAITTFTVEAYVCEDTQKTAYVCNGMYHMGDEFELQKQIMKRVGDWLPL